MYATHDVRTLYTRSHINAHAAVKLLLVLVVVYSVMLGVDPDITDVTQKRLCCNVLGEDVGRVVGRIDLDLCSASVVNCCSKDFDQKSCC